MALYTSRYCTPHGATAQSFDPCVPASCHFVLYWCIFVYRHNLFAILAVTHGCARNSNEMETARVSVCADIHLPATAVRPSAWAFKDCCSCMQTTCNLSYLAAQGQGVKIPLYARHIESRSALVG